MSNTIHIGELDWHPRKGDDLCLLDGKYAHTFTKIDVTNCSFYATIEDDTEETKFTYTIMPIDTREEPNE